MKANSSRTPEVESLAFDEVIEHELEDRDTLTDEEIDEMFQYYQNNHGYTGD